MSIHKGYTTFFFIMILFFSVSCSGQSENNNDVGNENVIQQKPAVTGTNVESISPVSPITPGNRPLSEPTSTPEVATPNSGRGTVVGILYDQLRLGPYADRSIYLAQVSEITAADGSQTGLFAALDVTNDPFAQTDETGRFVIENVGAGKYALAVRLPNLQELLLYNPDTGNNLIIEVMPGEILDMGVVSIREQP